MAAAKRLLDCLAFDPQTCGRARPVAARGARGDQARPNGGPSLYRPRAVHDDGRVFFNAADSLVPADSNGNGDVYQYEPTGTGELQPPPRPTPAPPSCPAAASR